ncbi:MAG: ATP-binding cassette domain-containing protein [Rhizobiaceae bacterium]|nr:MAG: ATP-binding cassette domain-containing protein [Rhizobiaceae bacterium]CAG0968389.1 High-affinity branched-chain amino acid transport ATP-binding protein LivF [Rhizobiaceae bacterium]
MLEVANIAVSYGRHHALEGVGVRIDSGEICVILGANGAGKSTLLKAIAGMVAAEPGGSIRMNGKQILGMKAHRIVEEGIALVPEGRGIFGELTVAENLQLGAFAARARRDEKETLEKIYTLFPRLAERKAQVARTMSGGEQQMVAIGRALMSKPEILMLDEPSLGLSPLLTQELFRALKAVAATGVGILLVEQNARQSLKIADRGYLIENGAVTGENSASALMNDPAVVNAYLGGSARPATAQYVAMRLPPPMRLPLGVEAIGRLAVDLAERAGRIQKAFVRTLRREGDLPSAFVGRFDPKAGGDPWADIPAPAPLKPGTPHVSADGRRLADNAAALSRRAAERLADHVRSRRLTGPLPSAFAAPKSRNEAPAEAVKPEAGPAASLNGSHGLIGHNSAGIALEEDTVPVAGLPPATASLADLAARAATIHAAHVAESRKRLSAFVIPAERPPEAPAPHPIEKPAKKKRKKH